MVIPDVHNALGRRSVAMLLCIALGGARAANAQVPITADSLKTVLAEVARTSHTADSLDRLDVELQGRAKQLIAAYALHNAEPCEYPQGQPELCANYDRERSDLNLRSADLQKEMKAVSAPLRAARGQFADLMTELRTATYSPPIASQKAGIVACTNLNGVAQAAACLTRLQRPVRRPQQ